MLCSPSLLPPESGSIPSARTPATAASPGSRTATATASNCGSLWLTRACFLNGLGAHLKEKKRSQYLYPEKPKGAAPALLRCGAPSEIEIGGDQSPNVQRKQREQAERAEPNVAIDQLQDRPAVHFGEQAGIGEVDALDFAKRKILERPSPHQKNVHEADRPDGQQSPA